MGNVIYIEIVRPGHGKTRDEKYGSDEERLAKLRKKAKEMGWSDDYNPF